MPIVVGISFQKASKVYYFEAGEHQYTEGGGVIVETARGLEFGRVAMLPFETENVVQPLKPIIRLATPEDEAQAQKMEEKRPEALRIAQEKINQSGLEMKLAGAEYTFDGTKLVLYFTAEARVDFRELVRELASTFRVRIELRQIGSRDECKLKGGLGPCGRVCCCREHLPEFAHVTIRMAKNQNLSLNPQKISGLCGRLMCCLSYENAHYAETNKKMPRVGSEVKTLSGKVGNVSGISQIKETVTLRIQEKDSIVTQEFPLTEIVFAASAAAPQEPDSPNDESDNI